jgi:hypothetical protein
VRKFLLSAAVLQASAARLAAHGRDVLLEKNLSSEKPCGGGLSLRAFEELGIPKAVMKREVHRIRIVSPRGEARHRAAGLRTGDRGRRIQPIAPSGS